MASPAFADRRRSATEFFKTANDFEQAPMQKMLEECLLNELAMPWKDPRQDTAYAYDSRAVHWEWQGDLCSQRDHPFYKDIFLEAVGTEESFGPGRVVPLQLMAHATEFVAADGQLKPRFTRFRCVTNKLMCTFRATPGSDAAVWLESRCPPGTQIMARVERIDYQRFQADVSMTPEGSDAKAMERDEESETRPFATPQLEDEFSLQMQADRRAGDSALVGKLLRPDGTVIDDTEAPKGERLHHLARHRLFSRRSEHELVRDLLRPDRRVGKVHFRSAANNAGVVAMMKVREKVPANVDRTFQIKSFYIKEAGEHYAGTGFSKRLEYSYPTESGVVTTAFLDIDEVMHRLVEPYHQRMRELVGHRKFCAEGVDRLLQDEGARQLRTGRSGTVPYFLTWDDQGCRGGFVLKWWSKYQKAVKSDPVEIRPEGFAIWLRVANTPELMIQHWKDSGASRNQMKQDYKKHVEKLQLIPSHEENLTGGHSGIVLNRQPQRLRLLQGVIPLAPDEVAQIRRDERMPDLEANALSDPITVGRHAMSSPLEDGRPVKKYAGTQGQLSNLSDAREDTPVTGQTGQEGPTIGYSDPYDAAFSPVERMDYSPDSPEDDYDGSGRRHRAGDGAGSSYGASIHASSEFGTGSSNLGSSNLGSSSLGSDPRGPAHAPVAGPSGSGPGSGSDSARGPQPKRKPAVPTWNRPAAEPSRDSDLPGYHPGQESEVEGGDPYTVDEARGLASESEVEGGDPGARPPKRAKR